MPKGRFARILWGSLVLTLAACSSRHDMVAVQAGGTDAIQPAGPADLIAAGRGYLRDQNYGLAIARFREALRFDTSSAAANNGLGIAYASVGRDDLARRYFERAIAFAPQDESYRRNFTRFAASDAPAVAQVAEGAIQEQSKNDGDGGRSDYHLRQEASSPTDRGMTGLMVALPAAESQSSRKNSLVVTGAGVSLVTSKVRASAMVSAPIMKAIPASYTLERGRAASRSSSLAPTLRRVSKYEVHIVARQPSEALAKIMKRDYLAQWNPDTRAATAPRDSLRGQDAFKAAIGNARRRIETSRSTAAAERACARARLITYGDAGMGRGSAQCSL